MRTHHYSPTGSQIAERLTTFRQQMADYARGEQFRALRQARHLSQEDAAHEIGVSTKALREWEKGGKIKWENAKAAAAFFGVDAEGLVSRETADELPILASQVQLDRMEAELAAIQVQLGTLSAQLAETQRLLARQAGSGASRSGSRKAK